MAIYSAHVSEVQRSKGQNAVAASAYNARAKLELELLDKRSGVVTKITYDYSAKEGIAYSKITAPDHAPDWVYDRQTLWNKAEQVEYKCNAQTARKIMLALPIELNLDQHIVFVEEFARELVDMGMVVDANIHIDKEGNPHAHLMMTTRELVENRYGEVVFNPRKIRDWGRKAFIQQVRVRWAELQNEHLALHGFDERVSEKSYRELGLDLIPGVHKGPAEHIKNAELVELNRQIAEENARRIEENPGLILDKLSINKPVFTKEEIASELEKCLSAGIDFGGRKDTEIESLNEEFSRRYMEVYTRIMNSPELSLVIEADLKGRELYTTTKRLELEERFVEVVESLQRSNRHALGVVDSELDRLSFGEKVVESVRDVAEILADKLEQKTGLKFTIAGKKPSLSLEQRRAVVAILNGSDISSLQGIPGAGKTTAMREIVSQYKKAGYTVIGVTASSSAALQLAKETGIECRNASLWRKEWLKANNKKFELVLRGDYYKEERYCGNRPLLTNKHVVIIDEASMMELSNMDYISHEVQRAGAKLIPIGDNNQLPAIGWAGGFKKVADICGSENLSESRRQQNPAHQTATKLLSQYRVREAIDIYLRGENIIIDESKHESRQRLINDYLASYVEKSSELKKDNLTAIRELVICTYTNKEGARLNLEIRELLKEAGVIKGIERRILVGDKHIGLARGEQIVFTRNFNRLGRSGIYNGEVGTVLAVSKPNKVGHSAIAILVNKADGRQERMLLDTSIYSKGNLFDYGYAVTSHKLQGATIDQLFVLHDKQVGYEAFNVMMTRHRRDVRLYANAEGLEGVLYESLDIDSRKAQSRYDLEGERENLVVSGLVKTTSKRINNSFASDYFNMGLSPEDQQLKHYIESNSQVIEIIRQITRGQQKQLRQTGIKPELWDHELWPEFKEKRTERGILAKGITASYEAFKDRLVQLGMNYATIQKHASDSKQDKYLVTENRTYLHVNSANYQQLFEAIQKDDTLLAKQSYINLKLEIAESYASLHDAHDQVQICQEEEHGIKSAIEAEAHYREVLLPAFLSRIYKEAPEQILANYQILIKEHGEESAAIMAGKKPALLGRLKGFGIGQVISFTGGRRDAVSVAENLEKQLSGFNKSRIMEGQLAAELTNSKFAEKISQLQQEIKRLKEQLPSSLDEAFLNKADEVLGKTGRSNEAIDLNIIRESDIFQDIWLRNIQDEGEKYERQEQSKGRNEDQTKDVSKLKLSGQDIGQKAVPILDFEEVKRAITPSVIEQIFRHYGQQLNPDGKFEKKANQLFCGSLNINLKDGRWYRFSDGSKGDLVGLVKEAASADTKRAFEIIGEHAGVYAKTREEKVRGLEFKANQNQLQEKVLEKSKDPWQPFNSIPIDAPKFNPVKNLYGTLKKNNWKVDTTYEYKSKDGDLIGYVVRVLDKEGAKQTLPVTYCSNLEQNKSTWKLKGFSDNGYKPIYRAEQLLQNPEKSILIVEGEKAADRAAKLLPGYTVISWMGGVQSADRVNWQELEGREVVIWPDNDLPGQQAARTILQAINKANGFSGFCSIVDTKQFDLPEKWDLADKLPYGMNINQIKEAITACHTKNKNLSDYELAASQFNHPEEQKIFWQQSAIGLGTSGESIREMVQFNNQIRSVLERKEIAEYMDYVVAKGTYGYEHSFLGFRDDLYKELLTVGGVNSSRANQGRDSAKELVASLEQEQEPALLVDKIQNIYRKSKDAFGTSFLKSCDQFSKDNMELKSQNPAKAELHEELVKDLALLHGQQLGVQRLSNSHLTKLSQDIAEIIKNYDLSYKDSQRPLQDPDRKQIAAAAHSTINTSKWWQELTRAEVTLKEAALKKQKAVSICNSITKTIEEFDKANDIASKRNYLASLAEDKAIMSYVQTPPLQNQIQKAVKEKEILAADHRKEFEMTIRIHKEKLDDISKLDQKFDTEKFKSELKELPDKVREEKIKTLWINSFKDHIAPKLDHFDKLKQEAKTVDEHLKSLKEQKDFSADVFKSSLNLVNEAARSLKDNRIRELLTVQRLKPDFIEALGRDLKHGINIGLWTEEEALKMLKKTDHGSIYGLTESVHSDCKDYHIRTIEKALEQINRFKTVEKDNIRFETHKAYLEHHINNPALQPYLKNTVATQKLTAIYKHEELQKQQELELQKTKALEKDHGMGGFSM